MAKILTIGEMLAALQERNQGLAEPYREALLSLATLMGRDLENLYEVDCTKPTFEDGEISIGVYAESPWQDCPERIDQFDPDGDWETLSSTPAVDSRKDPGFEIVQADRED